MHYYNNEITVGDKLTLKFCCYRENIWELVKQSCYQTEKIQI